VWRLYRHAIARTGAVATLYEWDDAIPDFETLHAEALQAKACRDELLAASPVS
jgi:hypothetical protein